MPAAEPFVIFTKKLRDINRIIASREDQWAVGKIEEMIRAQGLEHEWRQAVHFAD